jgi:hypothetical protein
MTTSHHLNNLRANADLAVVLKRALRLAQEIGDITFGESSRTDRWQLELHLDRCLGEAQMVVEDLGISHSEADTLVSQLFHEMYKAAPLGERAYLSVEEAIST